MDTKTQAFIASEIIHNNTEAFLYQVGEAAYTAAADQNPDLKIGVWGDEMGLQISDPYSGTDPELLEFPCIADSHFAGFYDLEDFLLEVWIPENSESLKGFLEEHGDFFGQPTEPIKVMGSGRRTRR